MTRIIAGQFRGRRLQVPAKGTRPTSDRVREALFSRLEHLDVLRGASVLDLYAGSGALGLEAASRGAAHVTLVDSARAAATVIRRNVDSLGLLQYVGLGQRKQLPTDDGLGDADRPPTIAVVCEDAVRFTEQLPLARPFNPAHLFDIVFLDPPYDLPPGQLARVLANLTRAGVLAPDPVVVVEQATRNPPPPWPPGRTQFDEKKYGETTLYFAD